MPERCLCSQRWCPNPHPEPLVLQDFLRKILSQCLGKEWTSALQESSRQEKLGGLNEGAW